MISLQSEEYESTMDTTSSTNSSTTNNYNQYFTETDAGLNIEANNIEANCITSKNNKFNIDSEGNLTCNTITADIELGNTKVNNITSTNNKFSIDSEGNLTCNSITTNEQNGTINFASIYPIGSIYMSVSDVNPSTLFTGTTWEKITDQFLVGAGNKYSLGSAGGTETHTHTSAAHSHTSALHSHGAGNLAAAINFEAQTGIYTRWTTSCGAFQATGLKQAKEIVNSNSSSRSEATVVYGTTAAEIPGPTGITTPENTGASSNIPPYLAVNIWKRIS